MKTRFICILLICACLLTGCTAKESPPAVTQTPTEAPAQTSTAEPELKTGVGFYFDTVVQVTLYGPESGLLEEIWAACERYENLLSRTVEGSDVSRINASKGQPVTVDPETWEILSRAKEISRLTGGAFSVSIAPMSLQWDFTGGTNRMPTEAERLAAIPLVDDEKIILGENHTVTLPEGMAIDLGGIAKGYIADQVAALVKDRVKGALLNFGGNVYAVGHKLDGSDYGLGIQDPNDATGQALAAVRGTDISLVTSGIYERYFMLDGVRYHHILDPKTGLPADSDLASATILHTSSMDADAFATACIVLGREKSEELLGSLGMDGVLITREGQVSTTEDFDSRYTLYMVK